MPDCLKHILQALCILVCLTGHAQVSSSPYTPYKRLIAQPDGLPDRNVNCGIQDKHGFMWFGLRSGLCRYDGSNFILLTSKSHGLRGTSILSLVADDSVGIIITYTDLGSSIFPNRIKDVVNINTLEVKSLESYYAPLPFPEKEVTFIQYRQGKPLQFYTRNTTFRWEYSHSNGFQRKRLKGQPLTARLPGMDKLSADKVQAIQDTLNENFLLEADSTVISFRMPYQTLVRLKKGYLISRDSFIGQRKIVNYFLNFKGQLLPPDSIEEDERGFLDLSVYSWSSNYYHDLNSLHPSSDRNTAITQLADGAVLLFIPALGFTPLFSKEESIHVNSYVKDRQGSFWLCTNVGIYKVTMKRILFQRLFTRDQKQFAFNNSARGIYADDELLFAALYDGPVLKIQKDTLILKTQQNFGVIRIDSILWFGDWRLRALDLRTRKVIRTIDSQESEIWTIYKLNHAQLLLGCTEGLDIYSIATNTLRGVEHGSFPKPKFIYKIFKNSQGQLMAVAENGLYVLSEAGVVIDYFSASAKTKTRQLPCATIYDVFEDNEGRYWIGSNLEGLFQWDKAHHTFRQFGISDGFLSTVIYRIEEDDFDNLWISTDFGVASLNKKTYALKTYTELDGITSNEFNRSSSFKDRTGRLYFGGMNGVTSFHPKDFIDTTPIKFPLSILDFSLFDSKTESFENKTADLISGRPITFFENNTQATLSFSLLDYEDRIPTYAYKIEGVDTEWNYSSENKVRISHPPYGNYRLRIKARLANGSFNRQELIVPIAVIRPFYKTWWFVMVCALLVLLLIIIFIKIRVQQLRSKNEKLELLINERTGELRTALNEKTALIQEIHHRVKNNLQLIQAMIDMQINAPGEKHQSHALIETSLRINAMTLVHEMLYDGTNFEIISLQDYIHELIDKLADLTSDSHIPIHFNVSVDQLQVNISNCLAIGMITSELVSNSIKHAFKETQHPTIEVSLKKMTGRTVLFIVKDNGKGMDKSKSPSGLGLRLIDIFTRQLKGTYSLENTNGLLFTFHFDLPE